MLTIASIPEGCSHISGSAQNTLVPGIADLADKHNVFMAGEDFKSGQTRTESDWVEFFVSAGFKPECIALYNHLGNNDGRNFTSTWLGTDFESTEEGCDLHLHAAVARHRAGLLLRNFRRMGHSQRLFGTINFVAKWKRRVLVPLRLCDCFCARRLPRSDPFAKGDDQGVRHDCSVEDLSKRCIQRCTPISWR